MTTDSSYNPKTQFHIRNHVLIEWAALTDYINNSFDCRTA